MAKKQTKPVLMDQPALRNVREYEIKAKNGRTYTVKAGSDTEQGHEAIDGLLNSLARNGYFTRV